MVLVFAAACGKFEFHHDILTKFKLMELCIMSSFFLLLFTNYL